MSFVAHLVFPESVSPELARKRTDDAVFTLFALDLPRFDHAGRQAQGDIVVERWREQGRSDTAIDLTANLADGLIFASVISADAAHGAAVAAGLAEFLAVPDAAQHLAHAAARPADGVALVRAAVAAGSADSPGLRGLIEAGLRAADPGLRGYATRAAALAAWPSLGPALAAALDTETDPQLRRFLEIAAAKCGRPGGAPAAPGS